MNDPHVLALRYRFVSVNDYDRYGKAAPMTLAANRFDLRLEDQML